MALLELAAHAQSDVDDIFSYIAKDNLPAAIRWTRDLDARMVALAEWPGMGTRREELRRGVRSLPFGRYLIFYVLIDGGIKVLRVLHSARDLPDLFVNDQET